MSNALKSLSPTEFQHLVELSEGHLDVLPLTLTPAARAEIRALGGKLGVFLAEGGCCGTAYRFTLERLADMLTLIEADLTLYLTPEALDMLRGAKLDYGAGLHPPRFRVLNNPNTPLRCGCNRSFGRPFPGKCTQQCQAYCPMPWHKDHDD